MSSESRTPLHTTLQIRRVGMSGFSGLPQHWWMLVISTRGRRISSASVSRMGWRTRPCITPSANPLYALAQAQVGGLRAFGANPPELLIDFGLDETGEISQRILPAEIARFHRNGVGKTFLHDV
jgi:hypothetical protein